MKDDRNVRIQNAINYKQSGKHNCGQSLALAYCNLFDDINPKVLLKLFEGMGLGMGSTTGTCGAISAAIGILGLKYASGNLDGTTTKSNTYKLSKEIMQKFEDENGSTICRDLKGLDSGIILRDCTGCVEDSCNFLEDILARDYED